jgi:chromosome segregation ATPase
MRYELAHDEDPSVDLDKTDELPALDVAAYEARLAASGPAVTPPAAESFASSADAVTYPAIAPAPTETLRDIEDWIAAQKVRDLANERALAQLRAEHADSNARCDRLATELENTGSALQTALRRANDGEQALLDSVATAHAAEARAAALATDLEQVRGVLSTTTQRLAERDAELDIARRSIGTSAEALAERQRLQAELARAHDERGDRIVLLEGELAALRERTEAAERELAQRAATIAALTTESDGHAAATQALERSRRAAEERSSSYLENLQSREWQRTVWEGMWRELDAELADARAALARLEHERGDSDVATAALRVELRDRNATVERLEAERAAQATALRELADERARDERSSQAATQDLAVRNAALSADVGRLEGVTRELTEALAAREADLAAVRSAHAALETALGTAQHDADSQAARVAELEMVTVSVAQALQAQTAAAHEATARLEASTRENAEHRSRIAELVAQLGAAMQAQAERATAAQVAETALAEHAAQLAASRERLDAFARAAERDATRIDSIEAALALATARAEHADEPRRVLEAELERLGTALARESGRVVALETQHRDLALELERTRGALEERELRIRRLERQAATSAEALGRIRLGIENVTSLPAAEAAEPGDVSATLVPLESEADGVLPLAQRTTIGRAPENDLCLQDTSISRRHALIVVSAHGSFIEDRHSVNGVTVNGRRIRHARLSEGDVITLGLRRFRFTTRAQANGGSH